MIYYSDLYLKKDGDRVLSKRFWDFAYAQQICDELEKAGTPFWLLLWDENHHILRVLTKFRIPHLQTSPH